MKKFLVLAMLLLAGMVSATPEIYEVVLTPLYANEYNTLTCRYVSNDSGATATYRFYDGDDGVWYSTGAVATYTSIEDGFDYNCSVNLTNGGSTGWYNSSNGVTVDASCLTPLPFYYQAGINRSNCTTLITAYPRTEYWYHVESGLLDISNDSCYVSRGFLFFGGGYLENGSLASWTNPVNWMYLETGAGGFALNTSATDENYNTADQQLAVDGGNLASYYPAFDEVLPAGSKIFMVAGILPGGAAQLTSWSLYGNISGGGTETLWSWTKGGAAVWNISNYTSTTQNDLTALWFNVGDQAAGGTGSIRVYEIEIMANGNVSGTVVEDIEDTGDLTADGALYTFEYAEEETGAVFNFSSGGDLNDSALRVYCDAGVTELNLTGDYDESYLVGVKDTPRRLETYLLYDDGSSYYRRMVFCSTYDVFTWWLLDASVTTPRLYTFNIEDSSSTYSEGLIRLKRYLTGSLEEIAGDEWDAGNSAVFYLVDNREYSITLDSDGCGSERNLGWVTTNPSSTTYSLTLSSLEYNTTAYSTVFRYVQFYTDYNEVTGRINFTYIDPEDETDWVWWGVYYASNDSLAYSDNSSTYTYHGSYLGNPDYDYYVNITFSHPGGSVLHFSTMVEKIVEYLEALEYTGVLAGFHSNTFFMMVSLGLIALTALVTVPSAAGVGGLMVFGEAALFSVIGWLPLLESEPGMLVLGLAGLLSLALAYRGNTQ